MGRLTVDVHATDGEILPIVQEEASISKRVVETGRVTLHTVVDSREETLNETLSRTDVDVARIAIGRFVETPPSIEERDGVTVVPIIEERLVVEKRLFLVEEIHLARRTTLEPVSQTITLRSTRAVIERENLQPGE